MLKFRLISGTALVVAVIGMAFWAPPIVAVLLLAVLVVAGVHECLSMLANISMKGSVRVAVAGAVCLLAGTFAALSGNWVSRVPAGVWRETILIATTCAAFVAYFRQADKRAAIRAVAATMFAFLYVAYLASFFVLLAFEWEPPGAGLGIGHTGRRVILYLVLVVKSSDVGAYAVGRLLGRRKMAPVLSPKKTWEGAAGGLAVALLCSLVFVAATHGELGAIHLSMVDAAVLGVGLTFAGIAGDLAESLLKRGCEIKDSGTTIPGMGGVLDVLDSLLFGAPALYLYLRWI